jgi:HNH endonuclease
MRNRKQVTDAELIARIKGKVQISESGCWIYPGSLNGGGYCQASFNGRKYMVHRFMYELTYGMKINPKLVVCHECDTPRCCNPEHLWIGTEKQNMRDAADKGRWKQRQGSHCKNGHEYTAESTRMRLQRGRLVRVCKECEREKQRQYIQDGRYAERRRRWKAKRETSATT